MERATEVEPATSSLGRAPSRERSGSPRMKTLEPQGFFAFRVPGRDPDFRPPPVNFDRNLPERDGPDVQLRWLSSAPQPNTFSAPCMRKITSRKIRLDESLSLMR
jgi:hypothetical protein